MIYLKIIKNKENIFSKINNFILNIFHKKTWKEKKFKSFFSSKSDSGKFIFYGFSNIKIGIDIEIKKFRNNDFINIFSEKEYSLLGGKNLENFYILWTAKESIIKILNKNLDIIGEIFLENFKEKNIKISNIKFIKKLEFNYSGEKFLIFSGINNQIIYSICIKN